jgi:hypothetical protein
MAGLLDPRQGDGSYVTNRPSKWQQTWDIFSPYVTAPARAVKGLMDADLDTLLYDTGLKAQEAVENSFDVAGIMGGASSVVPKPPNSVTMGAGMRSGSKKTEVSGILNGTPVYRGSPEPEDMPTPRDFPGVYVSADPESAAQYGQVAEYVIPHGTKIIDFDNLDPNSIEAGLTRAYLVGKGVSIPEDPREFDILTSELHSQLAGELGIDASDYPAFMQQLGFQGSRNGKDIFLYDPSVLKKKNAK